MGLLKILIIILVALILFLEWYFVLWAKRHKKKLESFTLERASCNPLISPNEINDWESIGTFNPAVVQDDEGTIHLLYRAVGNDGVSRIGHATTKDGLSFDTRSSFPVHEMLVDYDLIGKDKVKFDRQMYPSGGSSGGCEDPRAVVIDGEVYVTYTGFEGWHSMRIALTTIKLEDLKNERWQWKKPLFISPPGEQHKNWALFPEKINGQYVILHGVSPRIMVEYVDDLNVLYSKKIKSEVPHDGNRNYYGRKDYWDNSIRGLGPPPIKTDIGWLVLYHSMDKNDPNKYKLGAMILDINDPTKIIYRAPEAILSPEMFYENDGKPGVIYATGAALVGDDLMIFYGGGDKHVCMAHASLHALLTWLQKYGEVEPE